MYEVIWISALVGGALSFAGYWQNKKMDINAGKQPEAFDFSKLGITVGSSALLSGVTAFAGVYPEVAAMAGPLIYEIARRLLKGYNLPALPKV